MENDPRLLNSIIKAIREIVHPKPIAVKISPNIGAPVWLALVAQRAGADAITAINTVIVRPTDTTLDIPLLGNPTGYGGKSGKDLTVGGIFSARDVIDYAKNGARLFQVGSALVSEGLELFSKLKKGFFLRSILRLMAIRTLENWLVWRISDEGCNSSQKHFYVRDM